MSLCTVGLPHDEVMGAVRVVKVGEEHFSHMGHVVQGKPSDLVVVDHAIERIRAGAVVGDHA